MATTAPSSLEIAQEAKLRPITEIAAAAGLEPDELDLYGTYKAKVSLSVLDRLADRPDAKLVCVTAITPTKFGEGKTTTSVSLTQGLARSAASRSSACARRRSDPCSGSRAEPPGPGYAQVVPMEDMNLHFTGDIHAIGAANNLLAAMLEAHLLHGNKLGIDPLSISWRRCVDINDRALRDTVIGLGGRANGYPRQTGWDITAASEVMAIVAVARDLFDLRARLGAITVGSTYEGEPVTAEQLQAAGAMTVLLKETIKPNLVQTLEGQPAFVHCGPFANIAHGNNSLVSDRIGLKLGDIVVTESGFGADMGMEKFMDIVCRVGNLTPSAVVLVATVKALEHHGGNPRAGPRRSQRVPRTSRAISRRSASSASTPSSPSTASRTTPTRRSSKFARSRSRAARSRQRRTRPWPRAARARPRSRRRSSTRPSEPSSFAPVYPLDGLDRAQDRGDRDARVRRRRDPAPARRAEEDRGVRAGRLRQLPICMAKTHLSLSHDPTLAYAPTGFTVPVRDIRAYTGAGWLVALCGDMQTMPGYGRTPAAHSVDIDEQGKTVGLF